MNGNAGSAKMNISAAPECRKSLNVEKAVSDLDMALSGLYDAVNPLADALSPLLSSACPTACGEDRKPGDSEVAERVCNNAAQIRTISDRIRDLASRL